MHALLTLGGHQPDIDKIYLYSKDQYEAKYKLAMNKRKGVGSKYCNDFILESFY